MPKTTVKDEYPFVWAEDRRPKDRRGQRCRKTGRKSTVAGILEIQFKDGATFWVKETGLEKKS